MQPHDPQHPPQLQRDDDGYLHTPETMPQQQPQQPPVPTSQYGNVEVQHVNGQSPEYGYQSTQPLQPLPHKQDNHPLYPAPAAAKPDDDPYAFFMDGKPAPKKSLVAGLKKSSKLTKIVVAVAVVVIGLMITAVLLTGNNKNTAGQESTGTISSIVFKQQEILRVGNLASKTVESQDLQNFTATAVTTTTTSQQQLIAYINSHGGAFDQKQLAKFTGDSKIDDSLDAAQAASTYDQAYQGVMEQLLTDYAYNVASVRQTTSSAATRALMDRQASYVSLLQTMLQQD